MNYWPTISVIIPFYNRINLTLESIQSVVQQTYTNWELLLINDGSTESIAPIVQFIQPYIPHIRLITINHSGAATAKNVGLYYATGSYIAFLDSDDLFVPTKLYTQIKYMQTYGYVFCHTSYHEARLNGQIIQTHHSGRLQGHVLRQILASCPIATPTVMIEKKYLQSLSFVPSYMVSEDICFWLDLCYRYPLGGIDVPLSIIRTSSQSTKNNAAKIQEGARNVHDHLRRHPEYMS